VSGLFDVPGEGVGDSAPARVFVEGEVGSGLLVGVNGDFQIKETQRRESMPAIYPLTMSDV
jgi:hypothetical protein